MVSDDPYQRALEDPYVVRDPIRNDLEHARVGNRDAIECRALAEDREPGHIVRRLNVRNEPRFEALAEAFLDVKRAGVGACRR